jgi:hypothetical protein
VHPGSPYHGEFLKEAQNRDGKLVGDATPLPHLLLPPHVALNPSPISSGGRLPRGWSSSTACTSSTSRRGTSNAVNHTPPDTDPAWPLPNMLVTEGELLAFFLSVELTRHPLGMAVECCNKAISGRSFGSGHQTQCVAHGWQGLLSPSTSSALHRATLQRCTLNHDTAPLRPTTT